VWAQKYCIFKAWQLLPLDTARYWSTGGIVAGIIDDGPVDKSTDYWELHPQEIISAGQVVKAMILNGLLVSAPLYMFEKFFCR